MPDVENPPSEDKGSAYYFTGFARIYEYKHILPVSFFLLSLLRPYDIQFKFHGR
jgi:hypothetical protein